MPPVTRRSALRGAAVTGTVLALATGCSTGSDDTPPVPRKRRRDQLTADELVVLALVRRLQRSVASIDAGLSDFPRVRAELAPAVSVLRAHLASLTRSAKAGRLPIPPSPSTIVSMTTDPGPAGARTAALAELGGLRRSYLAYAEDAESGQFARLLASMGCALSQRLAELAP